MPLSTIISDDPYQKWAKLEWRSLEDIVYAYKDGKVQDTRLLLYTLELAYKEKYSLPKLSNLASYTSYDSFPIGFRVLNMQNLAEYVMFEPYVEVPYDSVKNPFLSVRRYSIETKR